VDEASLRLVYLEVISQGLSVRQTEDLVRRERLPSTLLAGAPVPRLIRSDPEARQIEAMFREALGTKVEVVRSGVGGRLVIHFYGDEQLQSLYEALTRS